MKIYYEQNILEESELKLSTNDRAFAYGDGVFETIILENMDFKHLNYHLKRLKGGVQALGMQINENLMQDKLKIILKSLIIENNLQGRIKIKIYAWRKEGGLFAPESDDYKLLIEARKALKPKAETLKKVSFCESIQLSPSLISKYKTLSSLPYIIAGTEKKKRKLEELILLDTKQNISECTSSNLFWIKDKVYYTPSLETGCVGGTYRLRILDYLKKKNIPFKEVLAKKEILFNAEHVFTCNVTGIKKIAKIDDYEYSTDFILEI